jgi:tetratricopeptide (TPR) repeat protein
VSTTFFLPAAAVVAFAAALFIWRKRVSREAWLALMLIFVPLLPVLNLGQVSREEYLVFDHYLYLSVAGYTYLVSIVISKLGGFESSQKESRIASLDRRAIAIAGSVVIVLAFTFGALRENKSWEDSYSVWSNVAQVRPTYWAGHYNAGLALLDEKRFAEARDSLERAEALKPDEPNVLDALGRAYDGLAQFSNAITKFKRAIDLDPGMFESYNNLGTVYFKGNDFVLAETNFAAALRLRPEASASRYNLGVCYARQGRYTDAARELERVANAAPDDAEALYELGLAYEQVGRKEDAVRTLQRGRAIVSSNELADKLSASLARLRGENR